MRSVLLVSVRSISVAVMVMINVTSAWSADEINQLATTAYFQLPDAQVPPFPLVDRASEEQRVNHGDAALVTFLTQHVQRHPADPHNGYYLNRVATQYEQDGHGEVARQYYRRALLRYPEVLVRGVSSHRVALFRLLDIVETPTERLAYLGMLQDSAHPAVSPGLVSFFIAQAYEQAGQWQQAYASYRVFLQHPGTTVPGFPDADEVILRRLRFHDSTKSWTMRDLDRLVGAVKDALWRQDGRSLLRHRAAVNFFSMSWEQELGDANSEIPSFDIGAFLRRSRVRFAQDLELSSNATEAYLRTWGWSHRIPTWYLYFRKVDYPADPDIHGSWEWAGIYFGDTL